MSKANRHTVYDTVLRCARSITCFLQFFFGVVLRLASKFSWYRDWRVAAAGSKLAASTKARAYCTPLACLESVFYPPTSAIYTGGVITVYPNRVAQVSLSGFVSVFFEKVLKSRVVNLSVWDRNFQVRDRTRCDFVAPGRSCKGRVFILADIKALGGGDLCILFFGGLFFCLLEGGLRCTLY